MSDTSPFLLATADSTLPNSRNVLTSGGLNYEDTGAEGTFTITTVGNLATLNAFNASSVGGILTYDSTVPAFVTKPLVAGTGINITNASAQGGNPTIAVTPQSTVQQVIVATGPVLNPTAPTAQSTGTINFVQSGGTSISATYNATYDRNDIIISSISGSDIPPVNASYIVQKHADLTNLPDAQALGDLATGILKSTTTTGMVSIASPTADYLPYSSELASIATITPTTGTFIAGNGTGFSAFLPSAQVGDILLSNGTAALPTWLAGGAENEVLTSAGPGVAPIWAPVGGGSGNAIIVSDSTQSLSGNTTYITNNATLVTFSLPVSPTPGEFYEITGYGAGTGGWTLPTGGKTMVVGTTTATTSISSVLPTDSVKIRCIDSTHFVVLVFSGQITVT